MTLRPTLPRFAVGAQDATGAPRPQSLIAEAQVGGGRVYYVRWGGCSVADFGLDANGLGVHARITRTNAAQACSPSPIGNVSRDTDFGNHAIYYPTPVDVRPVEMPYWNVDLDRGIWIPRDMACQIQVVGGSPTSRADAWPVFVSHELYPNETPPPLELTYARPPATTVVYLVDRPAVPGAPLPSIPADVRGAATLRSPGYATSGRAVPTAILAYDDPAVTTTTVYGFPGVEISLSGVVSVEFQTTGQWIFGVRW